MAIGQRIQEASGNQPLSAPASIPLANTLSIVIPVFNSAQSLPVLLARLNSILGELAHHYEVVLVNDGSPDQSGRVLNEATAAYPWMRVIHLMRNFGQHNALLCGIRYASGDVIVTME